MWNNLDCGRGITIAFCWLSGIFLPYMLLFATLLFPVSSIMFDIILVLLALPLWTTIYWFTDRDHIYEVYFRKFMRRKSNLKWHVITSLLTIGALGTMLLCVYLSLFFQTNARIQASPFTFWAEMPINTGVARGEEWSLTLHHPSPLFTLHFAG